MATFELIPQGTKIDFVRWCLFNVGLSTTLMVISIVSLFWHGLNLGIDFAGGTLVQVRFSEVVPVNTMRAALTGLHLGDLVIQDFGNTGKEVLIRVVKQAEGTAKQSVLAEKIVASLKPLVPQGEVELRRVEFVGPQVGEELTQQGILAIGYSLLAILLYVGWRFEFRFALGAILALVHDIFIILGVFSIFQREFTLVVVAAVLTVIGYSINDTVVVFDRIREEMKRMKRSTMGAIINQAINDTLSRTIIVTLTVEIVLVALLLVGGDVTFDFALAMLVGVVSGTYSSIYVASPVVLYMDRKSEQLVAP